MSLEGSISVSEPVDIEPGQWWYDRDTRVVSRHVQVVELYLDCGKAAIRRGLDGRGRRTAVSEENLRRRFVFNPHRVREPNIRGFAQGAVIPPAEEATDAR